MPLFARRAFHTTLAFRVWSPFAVLPENVRMCGLKWNEMPASLGLLASWSSLAVGALRLSRNDVGSCGTLSIIHHLRR